MFLSEKFRNWYIKVYKLVGKKLKIENEDNKMEDFFDYLEIVREDYDKQSKSLSRKLRLYSSMRVLLSCSIPVTIIYFKDNQIIPILISSSLAVLDFLLSFNKLPDKLHQVDNTINFITHEYNLFVEYVGEYKELNACDAEKMFKEKMINAIYSTDNKVTNKYDLSGMKDLEAKVRK